MDLHLFDLNLLVALDALLRECNVTQAGNRLNLSQPAMSGALARLRGHFQDELLVSVGRRMVRTPLGDALVEPVRDILLQVRGTLESRSGFDPATSTRHLKIAASDYVIAILMADALRRVRCEAPHITFDLRPLGPRADEALDNAELDFLIAPASAEFEAHASEVLFEDTFTCVAWSGNSAVGDTLSPEDYLNLGHVVVNVGEKSGREHRRGVPQKDQAQAPGGDLDAQLLPGAPVGGGHRPHRDDHDQAGAEIRRDSADQARAAADRDPRPGGGAALAPRAQPGPRAPVVPAGLEGGRRRAAD